MSSIILGNKIELAVKQWEDKISQQNARIIKKRYPDDIAIIIRNVREFGNGVNQLQGAFPIYYRDKISDVVEKYTNIFSEESKAFMDQMELEKSVMNENGMSNLKSQRLGAVFPEKLYHILKAYGKKVAKVDFFTPTGMKLVKQELRGCFIGRLRES